MRTALLAAHRTTADGALSAELVLAQRSVLAWQTAIVRKLGCEQIVLLAERAGEAAAELEQECRSEGIAFHRLRRFADLAALLHAEEELLIIADGLVPNLAVVEALLAPGGADKPWRRVVLCIADDDPQVTDFPEDFERIDASRCWAGVLVMRGAPAQLLAEFPGDSNALSLLLRMALQEGTACHTLTSQERGRGAWLLAHDAAALAAEEQAMIARHRDNPMWSAPGRMLAGWIGATIGTRGLRVGEPAGMFAGAILILTASLFAAFDSALAVLIFLAAGSLVFDVAEHFARLKTALLKAAPGRQLERLRDPGRDVLVTFALMLALVPTSELLPLAALVPLATGMARLVTDLATGAWAEFWRDRSLHLALLALATAFGLLAEGIAILALAALACAMFIRRAQAAPQ
jgi:hypothetical protein